MITLLLAFIQAKYDIEFESLYIGTVLIDLQLIGSIVKIINNY